MSETIHVLFLAAEATPFIKIGGLADVAGSLPKALQQIKPSETNPFSFRVQLILPFHGELDSGSFGIKKEHTFSFLWKGQSEEVTVYQLSKEGVQIYFLDGTPISKTKSVYSKDAKLDQEKYIFFSLASLELARNMDWEIDLVHVNDWHTAFALFALENGYLADSFHYSASLITIHNLPYMGGDITDLLTTLKYKDKKLKGLPDWAFRQILPMGVWAADAIVPVSESYAVEILTPEFGCGLQNYFKKEKKKITGVMNGLDVDYWDPEKDTHIHEKYSLVCLSQRKVNKLILQKKVGFEEDPLIPMIGMVTRIDVQKGVDLIRSILHEIKDEGWQFVILGTGNHALEQVLKSLIIDFPTKFRFINRFDEQLSHLIYAGSDMFFMPSRYEPCGISQMIAMRYGSIPVVHSTGGLKDSVIDGKTGFLFNTIESASIGNCLLKVFSIYRDNKSTWNEIQINGMKEDFSWIKSAGKYSEIYRQLLQKHESGGD